MHFVWRVIFVIFTIVTALSDQCSAYTCDEFSLKNTSNLIFYNCAFLSNSSVEMSCSVEYDFSTRTRHFAKLLNVQKSFLLEAVLYIDVDESMSLAVDTNDTWWCVKPKQGTLKYKYKNDILNVEHNDSKSAELNNSSETIEAGYEYSYRNIDEVQEAMISLVNSLLVRVFDFHMKFAGNSTVGVARILTMEECITAHDYFPSSCLDEVRVAMFSILPKQIYFEDLHTNNTVTEVYTALLAPTVELMTVQVDISSEELFELFIEPLVKFHMQRLNISNNRITNFNLDKIPFFNHLWYFNMEFCETRKISQDLFENMPQLRILRMSGNELSELPNLTMLHNLQILNMSAQRTNLFNLSGVQELQSLLHFNISHTRITLANDVFCQWWKLQILDLSYCSLQDLDGRTFTSLKYLQHVNLEGNYLVTLLANIFSYSSNFKILLSKNNLIGDFNLELKNISLLDLSNNKIKSPEKLIKIGNIQNLLLNNNDIFNWTSKITFNSKYKHINNVNLSYNRINTINKNMAKSIEKLKSIDIGANLLDCRDCSLKEFQLFLNTSKINIFNLNSSKLLACDLPETEKGTLISEAEYSENCLKITLNYGIVAGIPTSMILLIVVSVVVFLYIYRFEVTYLKHLLQVRGRNDKKLERLNCKFDVFVSYCKKDRDWVLQTLLPGLENPEDKYTLCLHERDFPLGSYIVENIVSHIEDSRRIILVLTRNFIDSDWCKWEVQMAQHRIFQDNAEFLVIIELERMSKSELPLNLRVLMESRTYLEWPGSDAQQSNNFWQRLKQALGEPLLISPPQFDLEDVESSEDLDLPTEILNLLQI